MKVSLKELLQTGHLGTLRHGMSKEQVQEILGPPDITGGTSRKYRQSSIFLYGTVELWFRQVFPQDLTGFWWEAGEKGVFHLTTACEIADWAFTPTWTFEQVNDYLNNLAVEYQYHDPPASNEDSTPWITLANGISISFVQGSLYGIKG